MKQFIPEPLKAGDRIAILSPASIINPDYVEGAAATLRREGYEPVVMPHTLGAHGSFSGTADERVADLEAALSDPSVRAIVCSRGGYGAVHLLERIADHPSFSADPKWLVGFSDVSALHALWGSHDIVSVHSSMAKQLSKGNYDPRNRELFEILQAKAPKLTWGAEEGNRCGEATAKVAGGNLAVISALIGTPFNVIRKGDILLLEDIAEPIYKVERIMWQLRLAGVLANLAGLVVGHFTDYRPSRDHETMEQMIRKIVEPYSYPVAYGAPVGHIDNDNRPLLLNCRAHLSVTPQGSTLEYLF